MPGPGNSKDALAWVQEAVATGHYLLHEPHFGRRCAQRGVALNDWKRAIRTASSCVAYSDRPPTQGGTNWRITGADIEGDELTVAVEAYEDQGHRALLITVF